MQSSFFRRFLCLLIAFCFAFTLFGRIEARADVLAGVAASAGAAVGINPVTAVACILVLLGVACVASNADAFWDLVDDIIVSKRDTILTDFTLASGASASLVGAWKYNDSYYFPEETIDAVYDYLVTDNVTYDIDKDALVHSASVYHGWTLSYDEGTLEKALKWLYRIHPDLYELANNYSLCSCIHFADGTWNYIFSDSPVVTDNGYLYPSERVVVHVSTDRTFSLQTGSYGESTGVAATYLEEGLYYYKTDLAVDVSGFAPDLGDNPGVRVDLDSDSATQDIITCYPVTIPSTSTEIENMTQAEAATGENSAPDVVVDYVTGEVIESNSSIVDSIYGHRVFVDSQTAIGSILIALGISPGTANTDFRDLINDIISVLPAEYTYNFESASYGNKTLLSAWKYNDSYYFSYDLLNFVNSYIWGLTDYADSIFVQSEYSFNPSFVHFDSLFNKLKTSYPGRDVVYNNSKYALIFKSGGKEFYVFSETSMPYLDLFYGEVYSAKALGPYLLFYGSGTNVSSSFSLDSSNSLNTTIQGPTDVFQYERSVGILGDFAIFTVSSVLEDFGFPSLTVTEDTVDAIYYPISIFTTLDDTETVTQTDVISGTVVSVPAIVVDSLTGTIVDVNIPTIGGNVGTDDDIVVDPPIGGGSNVGTGTGSDTITASGLLGILQEFGAWLLDLLWTPFEWLGDKIWTFIQWLSDTLIDGLEETIVWLAETIVGAFEELIDWLSSTLIAGIADIIEWLNANLLVGFRDIIEWLLSGIQALFVPKADYLSMKVDALCEEFIFAYSIIETAEFIGSSLEGLSTSPPVIYLNLGAAEGSYYYGTSVPFIDMRWYSSFKPAGDALLSALLWICFCWRVFVKLPGIISGVSGQFAYFASSDDRVSRD